MQDVADMIALIGVAVAVAVLVGVPALAVKVWQIRMRNRKWR